MLEIYAKELLIELNPLLPAQWEKIVMRGNISPGSYGFHFFVRKQGNDTYIQYYDLMEREGLFTKSDMIRQFRKLRAICQKALDQTPGEVWTGFTFVIDQSGHFSIDYEYNPDQPIAEPEGWEEKYLV